MPSKEPDYTKCRARNPERCKRNQSGCAASIWAGMGWAPRCWELHDHAAEAQFKKQFSGNGRT